MQNAWLSILPPIITIAVAIWTKKIIPSLLIGLLLGSYLLNSLAIPLAVAFCITIPLCVAAVITGGTFGDVTSPVAGMTNMSSNVAHADHAKYLKYAGPYNFISAGIAAVLFLIAGLFYN